MHDNIWHLLSFNSMHFHHNVVKLKVLSIHFSIFTNHLNFDNYIYKDFVSVKWISKLFRNTLFSISFLCLLKRVSKIHLYMFSCTIHDICYFIYSTYSLVNWDVYRIKAHFVFEVSSFYASKWETILSAVLKHSN